MEIVRDQYLVHFEGDPIGKIIEKRAAVEKVYRSGNVLEIRREIGTLREDGRIDYHYELITGEFEPKRNLGRIFY